MITMRGLGCSILGGGAVLSLTACGASPAPPATAAPPPPLAVVPPPAVLATPPPRSGAPLVTPEAQQPSRSREDDAEYRSNYVAAETIGLLWARENGLGGRGVRVGVMDGGVAEIPELAGKVLTWGGHAATASATGQAHPHAPPAPNGDEASARDHGTRIAAVIAARRNGTGVQGIAPEAQIVSLPVPYGGTPAASGLDAVMAAQFTRAADARLPVVTRAIGRSVAADQASLLAHAVAAYGLTGGLVVQSAGNAGADAPGESGEVTPANRAAWLFVSAVEWQGGALLPAPYANHCGSLADRCVVAPGSVVTHDATGSAVTFSGTSAAAAQVGGLAALILERWPHLSGQDAGRIILASSRDLGTPGPDPVFGMGLIDVQAALSPAAPKLHTARHATALAGAHMIIGDLFPADRLRQSLSGLTVVDRWGRDFTLGDEALGLLTPQTSNRFAHDWHRSLSLSGTMHMDGSGAGLADALDTLMPPHTGGGEGTVTRTAGAWHLDVRAPAAPGSASTAFGLTRTGAGGALGLALIDEDGRVLGTPAGAGALRLATGARTAVFDARLQGARGRLAVRGYATLALARLRLAPDQLVQKATLLVGARGGAEVRVTHGQDVLVVRVDHPFTLIGGSLAMEVPVGFDRSTGAVRVTRRTVPLGGDFAPRLGFGWERVGWHGGLRFDAAGGPEDGEFSSSLRWWTRLGPRRAAGSRFPISE
ncbi:hypothetical protein EYB45_02420 [Erythrobacteraceae bacterium CFH 75059]|uniref:S8 family serine peptidase n=1 Tax=Qipengyuania thermophila TaxID=2509361 RepID=UPI001020456A|nr:S8 family serine peptidase [Qipengyuania thermophila]TCD06586.1 hypothetical protein EYB45_02420 [Erythrobacteraceae bacterium CFH 75059]